MRWLGFICHLAGDKTRLSSEGIASDTTYEYSQGTARLKIKWKIHVDPSLCLIFKVICILFSMNAKKEIKHQASGT